ncbi:MAG TPA: hypothetical protein PKC28_08640 [Bdellovibrionales bacterium]|nr:hypothetical protein [Bdellovibrionales bacterium]
MTNLLSFLILLLFLYGRSQRFKNLRLHIPLMVAAFAADVLLVAGLVAFRDALSEVHGDMHWTLKVHIPIAVATLLFYCLATWNGYRLFKGDESARGRLRLCDRFLVPLRVLTLVTSVMVTCLR